MFQRNESDEIGDNADAVQEHLKDFKRFSKIVTLKAIDPFTSSEEALENANDVSEGRLNIIQSAIIYCLVIFKYVIMYDAPLHAFGIFSLFFQASNL